MLCLLSGIEMPLRAVRAQVASAVHLLICCERLADGKRKITSVAEALPLDEAGDYRVQELYVFEHEERGPAGEVRGHHAPTGLLPTFFPKLKANAIDLPASSSIRRRRAFPRRASSRPAWARARSGPGISARRKPRQPGPKSRAPAPGAALPLTQADSSAAREAATPAAPVAASVNEAASLPPALAANSSNSAPANPVDESSPAEAPRLADEAVAESTNPNAAPLILPGTREHDRAVATPASAPPGASPPSPPSAPAAPGAPHPATLSSPGKARAPGAVRVTTVPAPAATPAPVAPAPVPTPVPERKRSPAPSLAPSVTPSPQRTPAPSTIELHPELAAEVAAALPYESTLITRNPLLDREAPPPRLDEDATNPGARRPPRR